MTSNPDTLYMFSRRFLQTSVLFQKPLKSKLNRYERILNEIGPIYKEIKAERLRNLNLIEGFPSIKIGKIPSIETIKFKLENCSNWEEIKKIIPILKEIRFLGSPKRKEISRTLFEKLEEIYESNPENDLLIECLNEMVSFEQLNPLIIPAEVNEESSEIYKTIVYTAKDLISSQ